jgi:hypothetical protein
MFYTSYLILKFDSDYKNYNLPLSSNLQKIMKGNTLKLTFLFVFNANGCKKNSKLQ